MKEELDKKLVEKYPKIFRDRYADMKTTCMCWGFECGEGWYQIIDELCEKIQNHIDTNGAPQVVAVQVKEKFGGLRFYIDGGDKHVYELIHEAENKSYETCETCGSTENVKQTRGGWILTLCEKCSAKK